MSVIDFVPPAILTCFGLGDNSLSFRYLPLNSPRLFFHRKLVLLHRMRVIAQPHGFIGKISLLYNYTLRAWYLPWDEVRDKFPHRNVTRN